MLGVVLGAGVALHKRLDGRVSQLRAALHGVNHHRAVVIRAILAQQLLNPTFEQLDP